MKKFLIPLLFLLLILFLFITFVCHDIYIPGIRAIFCHDKNSCLHESAHKVDDTAGWISRTDEWVEAVDDYRMTQYLMPAEFKDKHAFEIVFFPGIGKQKLTSVDSKSIIFWQGGWGGYTELYASIAGYSGGDINEIPLCLQQFYNMDSINKTMKGLGY
jgi:hypothetical protein